MQRLLIIQRRKPMGNRNVIFLIVLFTSTKEDKLHIIYAIVSITFPETMGMLNLSFYHL